MNVYIVRLLLFMYDEIVFLLRCESLLSEKRALYLNMHFCWWRV